jgi:hypothetical protein
MLAGLLIASSQAAVVLVAPLYARLPATIRERWMGPMAVAACGILTFTAFRPDLAGSMIILAMTGAFGAYQITANTAFVERIPDQRRAQAFGIAASGLVAGQGAGFAAAGWAAQFVTPTTITAVAGGAGAGAACTLALAWQRYRGTHVID